MLFNLPCTQYELRQIIGYALCQAVGSNIAMFGFDKDQTEDKQRKDIVKLCKMYRSQVPECSSNGWAYFDRLCEPYGFTSEEIAELIANNGGKE